MSFRVSDYVTPSTSVRVRFSVEDAGDGSVIEAGIDGLGISIVTCDEDGLLGDINGDGCINGQDLSLVLGNWGQFGGIGDVNEDGTVDGADLSLVLGNWTGGCA